MAYKQIRNWIKRNRKLLSIGGILGLAYELYEFGIPQLDLYHEEIPPPLWTKVPLPSREYQLHSLAFNKEFDVLVIGGGATGCGVALDAVTRGFKTALVEKYDYSSGTSSRSTKLIHGGVRYLQKAIMNLDYEQYRLVKEALHERANLLQIAPHLSSPLPIMLPIYKWWQVPYYYFGIKLYDIVAWRKCVKSSYILSKADALEKFPMLKRDKLKAALVYYDGQHNDSRMNLSIALTAIRNEACMANHTEVLSLLKENGKVVGATVQDRETGNIFDIRAKAVINATGPFTDSIRKMDNPDVSNICQPSAGVHITLPGYYSPTNMGLLDPSTSDGRVIFFLPWENLTIAGTTDGPTSLSHFPAPSEEDIRFILNEIENYLSPEVRVRRGDVQAAWSGIRPLVTDPNSKNTQSISRNHVVEVSESGLVTIAGGKWTTYRSMAADAVDAAVKKCGLEQEHSSSTDGLILDGGYQWTPNYYITLAQRYGLEPDVAKHLANSYGNHAESVAKLAKVTGKRWPIVGKRIVEDLPYIEAEIRYAVYEYARTAVDVLARRTRIAFLNAHAAEEALPRVLAIMKEELKWSEERVEKERAEALQLIYSEMGIAAKEQSKMKGISLSALEMERYRARFNMVDKKKKGFITRVDIQNLLMEINEGLDDDVVSEMLNEVDVKQNGKLEMDEFLQLMSNIKSGHVASSRLAVLLKIGEEKKRIQASNVDRSGGGL